MTSSTVDLEAQTGVVTDPPSTNNAGAPSTDSTPNPQPPPNHNPRVTNTNDPPNEQTAKNLEVQRDENHGDSSDGLWSLYLTEAEKQDKEVTDSWKGDTDGILVFTGLFSATVATFITESLQNLTPDSSDQTNALLAQISQQLVNISNGTPLMSAATQIRQSFTPTPSAVRVNILWFLSLILSLSCALSATLMQQWARRYQELAQRRGAFHRRGRMRAYIYDGINRFKMARVVAAMPKLLHISVFLFFAGVVDFLFPIYPTLAYATLGCIMAFALPYVFLTVLPNIHLNCPYGTPLSSITWRISQLSVIIFLRIILEVRKSISKTWRLANKQVHESEALKLWREILEKEVKIRQQWFSQGMLRSVELSAYRADSTVVTKALAWTLSALDEDKEIEDFAARVPGFFNSRVVPDATSAVLSLMSHEPTADPIFGSRLYDLLKTCLPETSILDEEVRKARLRACLNCLWHFGRAYNQPGIYEPLPLYFSNALVPEITRRVQIEEDSGIRVMGHCFEALIVKKLAADLNSIKDVELACLSAILGTKSHDMALYLSQPDSVELANIISLSFEKIGTMTSKTIPSDVLDVVQQTLDILSRPMSTSTTKNTELQFDRPVPIICGSNGKFESILLSRLYDLLDTCLLATLPHRPERTSRLLLCLRGLWYFGRAFNQLGIHLPSDIYIAFLNSEVTLTQSHSDATVRVVGHCAMSLVVNKLAADINARTIPINDAELACLSTVLNTDSQGVIYVLSHPGAIQLANLAFLMLDINDDALIWTPTSNVLPVIQQTFSILSQALPAQLDAEMRLDLTDTLIEMAKGSPPSDVMRNRVFGMFLKNLWHFTRLRIESGDSVPLPSYLYVSFTHPGITGFILERGDITARVIRRCVGALIINKLSTDLSARTLPINDTELECLTSILDITNQDITNLLSQPGAVQFTNMVYFLWDTIYDALFCNSTSHLLNVAQQTFNLLSQAVPAPLNAHTMRLDLSETLMGVSNGTSSQAPSEMTHSRVLGMFLKNLWHFTRLYIERGNSIPLPSYFYIAFTHTGITRRIYGGNDITAHVTGRCVGALVVDKLVADIKSGTIPVNDAVIACISVILHSESRDVRLCLNQPGIVELVNMASLVLGYVDSFKVSDVPLDLHKVLQQTLGILSQAVPPQENTGIHSDQAAVLSHISDDGPERTIVSRLYGLLRTCISDTSPLVEEVRTSCLRMCLKTLWLSSKAYHHTSNPLPHYFPLMLASSEMTRHFQIEQDPIIRLTGCCFGALIASKLVDTLNSERYVSFRPYGQGAELACIYAILGTKYLDIPLRPHRLRIINLLNVVSLISSEIDALFTDSEGMSVDTLRGNMPLADTTKVTLRILADRLRDTRFIPRRLPMHRRQLLQEIYFDVEDAFGLHRLKHETMNALDRLQKKLARLLPPVGPGIMG